MKNKVEVFFIYFFEILLIVGCNNHGQPTMTATAIPKQTNTPLPTATLTPLPTFTPFSPLHATPTPPLPKGIFDPFQESIFAPELIQPIHEIIMTAFGVLKPDSLAEEKILVDSTMGQTVFSLFWEEGDLYSTLIQPNGTEISGSSAKKYFFYYGFSPEQIGTWTMRISGKSIPAKGSNYMVQVTSMSAAPLYNMNEYTDMLEYNFHEKKEYFSGDPITISFAVDDNIKGGTGGVPEFIRDVSMLVTIEDPAKKQYALKLYDDGLHEDEKAGDGIFANIFNNTLLAGKYNFYLQVSGKNNRANDPFTREHSFSIEVK